MDEGRHVFLGRLVFPKEPELHVAVRAQMDGGADILAERGLKVKEPKQASFYFGTLPPCPPPGGGGWPGFDDRVVTHVEVGGGSPGPPPPSFWRGWSGPPLVGGQYGILGQAKCKGKKAKSLFGRCAPC